MKILVMRDFHLASGEAGPSVLYGAARVAVCGGGWWDPEAPQGNNGNERDFLVALLERRSLFLSLTPHHGKPVLLFAIPPLPCSSRSAKDNFIRFTVARSFN